MTATFDGIGRTEEWENLRRREPASASDINVGRRERWISAIAAAAVAAYGLRRRRGRGVLLPIAGALIGRAVSGRCAVNRMMGRNSALDDVPSSPVTSVGRGEGVRVDERIVINRARGEVYRFWRNLENLPRFMDHLEAVTVLDERRSHWTAKGPAGSRVEWEAEIHNEIPNDLIAWRSLPGSDIANAGSVHFAPTENGDTEVRVVLRYDPPAGKVGAAVARLFSEDPASQVADDLRRLKQVLEAGEAG
ncbi:MAG: SRPBCC family protein [Gemmatimonadales bacterium]|nr:SRPBCC family protein [Gemmatimonadales bacterium]